MSPTGLLEGKVAMVTGAARGQGRAHALTCARAGADVVVVDLDEPLETVPYPLGTPDDLAETVAEVRELGRSAISMAADVRDRSQLDRAVERAISELGQVDILIANAGIWTRGRFWELTEDQWDEMIAVNLTGLWKSAKAVAPHMIERGEGSIVITPYGIRCNSIHPGAILTPMIDQQEGWDNVAGHEGGTREEMMEGVSHFHALKGAAALDPQTVADAALFLNSDLAARVTGAAIPVDAGHLLLSGFNHEPEGS